VTLQRGEAPSTSPMACTSPSVTNVFVNGYTCDNAFHVTTDGNTPGSLRADRGCPVVGVALPERHGAVTTESG